MPAVFRAGVVQGERGPRSGPVPCLPDSCQCIATRAKKLHSHLEVSSLEDFAGPDEEILEALIMESKKMAQHTKTRSNESKRRQPSQPLEVNSLEAFAGSTRAGLLEMHLPFAASTRACVVCSGLGVEVAQEMKAMTSS